MRSTPATARMVLRYLFQSWVKASHGGKVGCGLPMAAVVLTFTGGAWSGILICKWLLALAGVLRSQSRSCESLDTAVMMPSAWGLHWVE